MLSGFETELERSSLISCSSVFKGCSLKNVSSLTMSLISLSIRNIGAGDFEVVGDWGESGGGEC